MSKILKNNTLSPITVDDVGGVIIPVLPATYTIPPQDYWEWAASNDIVGFVGSPASNPDITVNDGSKDLTISCGIDLIKGIYRCEDRFIIEREYATQLIAYNNTVSLISFSPTTNKRIANIMVGGDGDGEFTVEIDGVLWGTLRNSWNRRNVSLRMDQKSLTTAETLTVKVKNVALGNGSCNYEAYVYFTGE